jgi:hypothetical protein
MRVHTKQVDYVCVFSISTFFSTRITVIPILDGGIERHRTVNEVEIESPPHLF